MAAENTWRQIVLELVAKGNFTGVVFPRSESLENITSFVSVQNQLRCLTLAAWVFLDRSNGTEMIVT